MWRTMLFLCLALASLAQSIQAATLAVTPVDAMALRDTVGGPFAIDPSARQITVLRWYSREERGILEFPLSALPAGAIVQSARLSIQVCGYSAQQGTPITYGAIEFHGYAADGQLEPADATRPFNLLATTSLIYGFGIYGVDLPAGYLQGLHDQGRWLGLMAYQHDSTQNDTFYTTTGAAFDRTALAPTLTITYVPEPAAGLLGLGALTLLRRRAPRP